MPGMYAATTDSCDEACPRYEGWAIHRLELCDVDVCDGNVSGRLLRQLGGPRDTCDGGGVGWRKAGAWAKYALLRVPTSLPIRAVGVSTHTCCAKIVLTK